MTECGEKQKRGETETQKRDPEKGSKGVSMAEDDRTGDAKVGPTNARDANAPKPIALRAHSRSFSIDEIPFDPFFCPALNTLPAITCPRVDRKAKTTAENGCLELIRKNRRSTCMSV